MRVSLHTVASSLNTDILLCGRMKR